MTVTREVSRGERLPERRLTAVKPEHIMMVALILRDSNPIHFDLDAVAEAGLGDRLINQGGATMAYVMDLLAEWTGSRASLRRISCAFRASIASGDDVVVGGEVTSVSETSSGTIVDCAVWAEANGRRAIEGTATVEMSHAENDR